MKIEEKGNNGEMEKGKKGRIEVTKLPFLPSYIFLSSFQRRSFTSTPGYFDLSNTKYLSSTGTLGVNLLTLKV